jgi:ribosomal protein S12 methylthiotransferase
LVIEAKGLIDAGVKEINLIAQDTTMYGADRDGSVDLVDLLERLLRLHGIQWIRILYCHPSGISDRLLALMDTEEAMCPYIDLPLQHIHEKILKAMGRDVRQEDIVQLIQGIRSMKRSICLRTTFILGFPGETDEIFEDLYEFVSLTQFDRLGAFIFSPEKGTPAARMGDIPDAKIAEQRLHAIMDLQRDISEKKNQALVGQTRAVLIEGESDETDLLVKGRTATMAPDVDGRVLINKGRGDVGEIVPVRFTAAYPYDLIGEIVS